jgi:hypothetical protein
LQHVDAAPPTVFVARYKTDDGTWTCAKHATMDDCTRSCTAIAQQAGMTGGSPQCNCTEDVSCP